MAPCLVLALGVAGILDGDLRRGAPDPPDREVVYEEQAAGGYRFQGACRAGGPRGRARAFSSYRILDAGPEGVRCLRELRNPAPAQGPGNSLGMFFLALNPDRPEVYLTSVVEAARIVTREVVAVDLAGTAIRSLGSFSTASDGLAGVRVSPGGHYLSFQGLWGNRVLQGLTVVRVDAGGIGSWPTDPDVRRFRRRFPAWSLEVTGHRWTGPHRLRYRQRARPDPEAGPGGRTGTPGPAREREVDVRDGRVLWERPLFEPEPAPGDAQPGLVGGGGGALVEPARQVPEPAQQRILRHQAPAHLVAHQDRRPGRPGEGGELGLPGRQDGLVAGLHPVAQP